MAISKLTVTGINGISNWLQANAVPTYFASVTYDSSSYKLAAKDSSENKLFEMNYSSAIVYKDATHYDSRSLDFSSIMSATYVCVKCNGGILIFPDPDSPSAHSKTGGIIITKNQAGKTVFVVGGNSASLQTACSSGVVSAAWGDSSDMTKLISYTPTPQNQTQFVPFTTYAVADSISYTQNAFYLPTTQYDSIGYGKISDGHALYITNGFWAVKDI